MRGVLLAGGTKLKLVFLRFHSAIGENKNSSSRFAFELRENLTLAVEKKECRSRCHANPDFFHAAGKYRGLNFSQRFQCR
jgi:hypothetical protein